MSEDKRLTPPVSAPVELERLRQELARAAEDLITALEKGDNKSVRRLGLSMSRQLRRLEELISDQGS